MAEKIVTIEQAIEAAKKLQTENKKIVLAGGCFDLLHKGHISFLKNAKKEGDALFILLEHDQTIKQSKGEKRPINTQADRAYILENLIPVDYIVLLPPLLDNDFYDNLVIQLKPAIIATTAGDKNRSHKERQAFLIQAKVIDVTLSIQDQSTTRLFELLEDL